jgi:hypothetical protein
VEILSRTQGSIFGFCFNSFMSRFSARRNRAIALAYELIASKAFALTVLTWGIGLTFLLMARCVSPAVTLL